MSRRAITNDHPSIINPSWHTNNYSQKDGTILRARSRPINIERPIHYSSAQNAEHLQQMGTNAHYPLFSAQYGASGSESAAR